MFLDQQIQEHQHRMNQLISQQQQQQQQHAAAVVAAQQARAVAVQAALHRQQQQQQQQLWPSAAAAAYHLSSFQQITPPGLQAFWPPGPAGSATACRSACCCCSPFPPPYGSSVNSSSTCSCCCAYPGSMMLAPPTPLLSAAPGSGAFGGKPVCLGCVQGTCRVGWNKENVNRLRSLWRGLEPAAGLQDVEEEPDEEELIFWIYFLFVAELLLLNPYPKNILESSSPPGPPLLPLSETLVRIPSPIQSFELKKKKLLK